MKIQLTNFCCWESQSFEFPDEGNMLISAPSGSGKTSIIRGIQFALFGTGTKVVQFGKRKCEVILEYKNIHIKRTKGPCRLIVNNVLEDDEAQEYIYKTISKSSMFHLEQNQKNTFVYMSPLDKLAYIETIAFESTNIQEMKTNVKNYIKQEETKRIELESRLSLTMELMESMNLPETDLTVPSHLQNYVDSYDTIEKAIDAHRSQYATDMVYLRTLEEDMAQITRHNDLLNKYNNRKSEYLRRKEAVQRVCTEFLESHPNWKTTQESLQSEIHTIETKIGQCDTLHKYHECSTELSRCKTLFTTKLKSEYEATGEKLRSISSQRAELPFSKTECTTGLSNFQTCVSQYGEYSRILERYNAPDMGKQMSLADINDLENEYTARIESIKEKQHKVEQYTTVYTCPSCDAFLRIEPNDTLSVDVELSVNGDSKSEILETLKQEIRHEKSTLRTMRAELAEFRKNRHARDILEQQLREFATDISDLNLTDAKKRIEEYTRYLHQHRALDIEESKYTERFRQLKIECVSTKSRIRELQDECNALQASVPDDIDTNSRVGLREQYRVLVRREEQINCEIEQYQQNLEKIESIEREMSQLDTRHLREMEPFVFCITFTEKNMATVRAQLVEYSQKPVVYADEQSLLHRYAQYMNARKQYQQYQASYEEVSNTLKSVCTNIENGNKLKSKIAEAESYAISTVIETINTSVQEYLDGFFRSDPISIRLVPFKKTKTQLKHQIELEVLYKNTEMSIASLSGGERDRVVLAFMMALTEMSNSPFLLLDECVSSLDQDTANIVFNFIQSRCKSKCTILIAHQIITGIFDNIIDLRNL